MIFSNTIYKIPNGKNISLFFNSDNDFDLYVFSNNTKKYNISYSSILKCIYTNENFNYNSVIKLNENHSCCAFDDNMSIINNE